MTLPPRVTQPQRFTSNILASFTFRKQDPPGTVELVRKAGQPVNPYADALDAALSKSGRAIAPLQSGNAIVHVFTRRSGSFLGISAISHGEIVASKPRGFFVSQAEGIPTLRKIGTILTHFSTSAQFRLACIKSVEREQDDFN